MIQNFEMVTKQLGELAAVINCFKSEAVQLRIIERIFDAAHTGATAQDNEPKAERLHRSHRGKRRHGAGSDSEAGDEAHMGGRRNGSSAGAVAQLTKLAEGSFFDTPRSISDIVKHCETNLARRIKACDISGKLGRMVRNGELTRTKNGEGQYEYRKP